MRMSRRCKGKSSMNMRGTSRFHLFFSEGMMSAGRHDFKAAASCCQWLGSDLEALPPCSATFPAAGTAQTESKNTIPWEIMHLRHFP